MAGRRSGSAARAGRGGPGRLDPALPAALVEQWKTLTDHSGALSDADVAGPAAASTRTVADLLASLTDGVLAVGAALREALGESASAGPAGPREAPTEVAPAGPRDAFRVAVAEVSAEVIALAEAAGAAGSAAGASGAGDLLAGALVEAVGCGLELGVAPGRPALKAAVRHLTALLVERAPGRTVELRVPPFAAVQIVEGPRHTRGTPPNVVEADPAAFVLVATGRLDWAAAVADGRVRASGERADLRALLPLPTAR